MAEIEISADQVPAEALAALSVPQAEVEIDPVDTLDSAGLFELSKNKMFSPLEWAEANPDRATDPAVLQKLSDTHARIRERGFTFSDLPTPTQAIKGVGHMVAGLAKQGFNYASAIAAPFIDVAASLTGQGGPGFSEALAENAQRGLAENIAGTEAAATGLAQLPGRALGKLGQVTGLVKPYTLQTDEEKAKAFLSDLGTAQQAGEIAKGRGAATQFLSGEVQKELTEAGKPVRPEEVELTAAGDPLSFLAFGKLFGVAGKLLPSALTAALVQKAGEVAAKVGGRGIQTAGKLTEFGGAATKAAGKVAPIAGGIVGATKGASLGSPVTGAIAGLAAGERAGAALKAIGRGVVGTGERLTGFGEQVATGAGLTPWSQAARDVLLAAPIVASETLKGAGFDLALAAATSESPQETEAAAAFGTVLGGLKGVGHGALKVAQGQIIAPRAWGTPKATAAYPNSKTLNALHARASASAPPGQVQRANAIRQFLKGAGDEVQAYLMPDATAMEAALIERGIPAAQAKAAAESQGMFVGELVDDAGNPRRVVLLNNADAAPHEAFHGIQDVLGEAANSVVDGLVFQEYAPQWEALGQQYARRLGGEGDWREVVLDRSGWGNRAAAEKALRDAANKIRNDTGAEPRASDARALAEKVLQQAREAGAEWRDILTTEEAAAEANRYLARELAAENFDAAFKNLGAGLTEGKTLPEKLARIVARTAAFMGAEPLAGIKTEGLQIEPRFAVTEAVTGQGREAIKPATPTEVAKWTKLPETPAEGAAEADRVLTWLQTATIPVADRAAAAQTLAEAMKNQQGVRLSYWGAKGEPGGDPAALRPERRAEIEAQRDAPNADRDLVTKDYFPYGAIITSKGPQFKGWSPNNFNANVARFTEWITANPEAARRLPLAHDLATEAGQRGLQADLQTFIQNQQAGFTGSGLEVVVPAGTGATPPVRTGVQPVSLPQARADAISYLFNLKLPETPRITTGKLPLNIVGQRVSEATMPGRITEPIRPRGEFIGPKAEALGIEGERVREVNPFRKAVEQVARDAGTKPPELIEAAQILALDRIADATVAPELPPFGGNVVTLTAGFLPAEARSARVVGEEILRMTPDEFSTATRGWSGGLTGEARKMGLNLKSPEELASLRQFATDAQATSKAAMARKDFDTAMSEVAKVQMFNEAIQSATGTGSNGEALRTALGADYKPPFPEGGAEATIQALPKRETDNQYLARKRANEKSPVPETFFLRPDGTMVRGEGWMLHDELARGEIQQLLYDEVKVPSGYGSDPQTALDKMGYLKGVREGERGDKQFFIDGSKPPTKAQKAAIEDAAFATNLEPVKETKPGVVKPFFGEPLFPEGGTPTTQALPAKRKNEFKLLPAGAAGSKAWVLPGGKVEQLGAQWHHDWLDKNKAVQEKYGLEVPAFEGGDAEGVREQALKKGFARVNYSRNTGTLTVEARAKDWRKQKVAVEKLIEENLDDIDNVTVHLMDESVQKVVDSASERLFNYDSDVEKLANLPFITKGEVRGGSQFLPKGTPKERVEDLRKRNIYFGESRPEAEFPPGHVEGAYWMSPDGDIFRAGQFNQHDSWARNNIVGETMGSKILMQIPIARNLGPELYASRAKKEGWAQLFVKPDRADRGIYVDGKPNKAQREILEDWAFENKQSVYDRNTDKILLPSTEEFATERKEISGKRQFSRYDTLASKFTFLPSENKAFTDELKKIRSGESGGQTFNADGSVWKAPETPSDIVTLASVNIPREKLTVAEFEKATAPYQDLLSQPNVAAGVFAFEQGGKPSASIDINAVVPQSFRENTLAFAKANDQVAIWDAAKNETVEAGGAGNTKITSPEQMRAAAEALAAGEPFQFLPAEKLPDPLDPLDLPKSKSRFPSYWISPDGKLYEAEHSHLDFAKAFIAPESTTPNETAMKRGWARFRTAVEFKELGLDNARVNPKQKAVIESIAADKNLEVQLEDVHNNRPHSQFESQFLPAEQAGLPGITAGREFDRKVVESLSQAQLKEYFPEAIVPKKNSEYIPSEIADSPLSKEAGSKEAAVQAFADKLVQFYRSREDNPALQAGTKWYSEFTPMLKKEFGKDSRIFAELLAATSPNNPPSTNFAFALDALQNWKAGKYDKMISKFNEGLSKLADGGLEKIYQRDVKSGEVKNPPQKPSDATYLAHWIEKNNLIPLSSSGKRFSMHSVPVLKVLARKWMTLNTGAKTDNFIKNLVGEGDEATVDVWADRTMRRLGYEGFKDRWRIMPRNKTGVTDVDFVFSQQAFRKAAEELGMKPSALQGALWFAEKQHWNEQGWARLDLGDYKTELERMPQLRAGFKSREALAKAEAEAAESTQNELEILPRQFQPKERTQPRLIDTLTSGDVFTAPGQDKKELEILPR